MPDINLNINANITDAIKGIDVTKKSLKDLDDSYDKMAVTSQRAFSASNDEIKTQRGLIEDVEKSIKDMERARDKAHNVKDIERYNRKIAEGKKHLEEYRTRGVPAIQRVNKEAGEGQKIFTRLGAIIASTFAVTRIVAFAKESIRLYDIQAKAEKALEIALGRRSDALLEQASALQQVTIFGDEAIIQGQAFLAQMGLEEEQIKRLTPAILDFAAAKQIDLKTAFDLVAKSVGSSTNALSRYGITIKGTQRSEERLESAVKNLNRAFEGQAQAAAEVGAGSLQQLSNLYGDAKESAGRFLLTLGETGPIAELTKSALDSISDSLEKLADINESRVLGSFEKLGALVNPMLQYQATEITKLEESVKGWAEEIAKLPDNSKEMQLAFVAAFETIGKQFPKGSIYYERFKKLLIDTVNEVRKLGDQTKNTSEKISDDVEKNTKKQLTAYEKLLAKLKELQKAYDDQIYLNDERAQQTALEIEVIEDRIERMDKEKKAVEELNKGRQAEIETFEDGIKLITEYEKKAGELPKGEGLFDKIFGDKDKLGAAKDIALDTLDTIAQLSEMRINDIDRQIDAQNRLIDETQRAIEVEADLKKEGFANDLALEKEKLAKLQEQREENLKLQEKAIRQQQLLSNVESAVALSTAIANIIKSSSVLGVLAPIAAGVAIAAILTLFSRSKAQASSLSKFEKGGFGIVDGPSHLNGGVLVPGVGEIEGKEAFSVFNKKATRRHGKLIENITNAINKDNIPAINMMLNGNRDMTVSLDDSKYMKENNQLMRKMVSTPFMDGNGRRILRKGMTTRIYK